jgi:hypothetical protein
MITVYDDEPIGIQKAPRLSSMCWFPSVIPMPEGECVPHGKQDKIEALASKMARMFHRLISEGVPRSEALQLTESAIDVLAGIEG